MLAFLTVRDWLSRLWRWLGEAARIAAPVPAPLVPPPPASPAPARNDLEDEGEFYFKGAILDQLDDGFATIARMRKVDRDAYDFFAKVDAQVAPLEARTEWDTTRPFITGTLPSIGGIYMHGRDDPETIFPRLIYFEKYKHGAIENLEPAHEGETLYSLSLFFDERQTGRRQRGTGRYAVAVGPDGSVRTLRCVVSRPGRLIYSRHGPRTEDGHRQVFRVPARGWDYPTIIKCFTRVEGFSEAQIAEHAARLFAWSTRAWESATVGSMTRVQVTKGGLSCVFSVNILRTPYFFRDRDVTIGESGSRKKIFHIVRTHERTVGHRQVPVRTHFRGERRFTWNGYEVLITVPGWHHSGLEMFEAEAFEDEEMEPLPDAWMRRADAAKLIADIINRAEHHRGAP